MPIFCKNIEIEKKYSEFIKKRKELFILGGDGTYLLGLSKFNKNELPMVFGFNFGTTGSNLPFNKDEFFTVIANKYETVNRHRILINDQFLAANEIVIRSSQLKLNKIEMVNFGIFYCDGIIISTASGSTGYNASNDGPILLEDSKNFIINLIAPNCLNFKPIVLSFDEVIEINFNNCDVYIDGIKINKVDQKIIIKYGDTFKVAVNKNYSKFNKLKNIMKIDN